MSPNRAPVTAKQRLSLASRLMAVQYTFLRLIRHRSALVVAAQQPTEDTFESFHNAHLCLLITFKRNGDPVPRP
jgi:hypothetical protein